MSRTLFILIVFVTALQGCVSSREVFLADGTRGHNINCSGSGMNYSNCLEKAGEICGARGYHLLNQQGEVILMKEPSITGEGFRIAGDIVNRF